MPFSRESRITYYNYYTKKQEEEVVWGQDTLCYLYGKSVFAKTILFLIARFKTASFLFGLWQSLPLSKKNIAPFIEKHKINQEEFADPVPSFTSFDNFFTRKLNSSSRPFPKDANSLAAPADGRYRFFSNIEKTSYFPIKGVDMSLEKLLGEGADLFVGGSLILIRLCPSDYHRYHFPCSGVWAKRKRLKGALYSVNPIAYKKRGTIFLENERIINLFSTKDLGTVGFIEIGATCVGKIHRTHFSEVFLQGEELGYFSFGGSSLVLLLEKEAVEISQDLLALSKDCEVYLQTGHLLGSKKSSNS